MSRAKIHSKPPRFSDHGIRDVTTRSWFDPWRNRTRVFTYRGRCVVCRRATWDADDGENDPRGVLGDNAASPLVAIEYGMTGTMILDHDSALTDVPLCFPCANDHDRYDMAVALAIQAWKHPS